MNTALIMARLPTAALSVSMASCVCYRSHVVADFHEHNYINTGGHREINAWWQQGNKGFNTEINPVLMADGGSSEDGEIRLGFIRPRGRDRSVVVELLAMEDRRGKVVDPGVGLPLRLAFKRKEFSIYGVPRQEGPVAKHYAEFKIHPELSIAAAPYHITLRGYYLSGGGARERIDARIVMDLKRERELTGIVDCWP
ncbi:hypothetical protein [Haloferula sp. BvORR071]|uniref:hypothetical protein n=1 Tax=Haloferula sp. BvORR071 TaxID=1396141 RepID=UPI000551A534|nr:hypothetical protein [Haloferula sp. BvORR071]